MTKLCRREIATYALLPVILFGAYWFGADQLEPFQLLLRMILLIFGYLASVGDIRKRLVPNRLVLTMLGAWVLVMIPQLFLHIRETVPLLINSLIGAVLGGAVFLTVYLLSRGGLGGGDVKFMTAAGLYLGLNGVLPVMLVGSVLAAVSGLFLIAIKKLNRKGAIALIPFLYVGIVLVVLFR